MLEKTLDHILRVPGRIAAATEERVERWPVSFAKSGKRFPRRLIRLRPAGLQHGGPMRRLERRATLLERSRNRLRRLVIISSRKDFTIKNRVAVLLARRQSVPFADTARERARLSDVQNDAAVYFAFSQSTENFIDGIERELLDRRLHFAFGGKAERFLKIFSCAHDRASESIAT